MISLAPIMSWSLLRALLIIDPLIVVATVVSGSVSVLVSLFDSSGRIPDRIARFWARLLLRMSGVKVRVRGLHHLSAASQFVFAGNHLSLMDTPVVLGHIPLRYLFVISEKYVRIPFLGTHVRRTGHFAVDQDDVKGSLKALTQAARAIRERGLSVLLFPEGTRAAGEMGEFKEGAAYIAIKAGVPVIPFAISGTRQVLPVGSIHVRPGTVDLVLGEPIATAGLELKDRGRLTALLRERVAELLARIGRERTAAGAAEPQPAL